MVLGKIVSIPFFLLALFFVGTAIVGFRDGNLGGGIVLSFVAFLPFALAKTLWSAA